MVHADPLPNLGLEVGGFLLGVILFECVCFYVYFVVPLYYNCAARIYDLRAQEMQKVKAGEDVVSVTD